MTSDEVVRSASSGVLFSSPVPIAFHCSLLLSRAPKMSLLVSTPSSSKRNSARLDLLTAVLNEPQSGQKQSSSSDSGSPRDSLSPLDDRAREEFEERGRSRHGVEVLRSEDSPGGQ